MMITVRPMGGMVQTPYSDAPGHLEPIVNAELAANPGWPGPIFRRPAFAFLPQPLPPVNVVRGTPPTNG